MITLLMMLLWEPFSLPGTARPVFGFDNGKDGCWLLRQEDGEALVPWLISVSGSREITLPAGVRFVGFHPQKPLLALFFSTEMRIAEVNGKELVMKGPARSLTPALTDSHPWLTAKGFRIGERDWLSLVAGNAWYMVDWEGSEPIVAVTPPREELTAGRGLERAGAISYLTPSLMQGGNKLYWMDAGGWFGLEPGTSRVTTGKPPELRNMEQASAQPLSFRDQPVWFVYGGDRGSLKSFGWRLQDTDGTSAASGKGIVVRFGAVERNGSAYLFGFTVPSKMGAQIWSAISGSTTFQCTRVVLPQRGQKQVHQISFKMEKTKKRWFGLEWRLDWNGDGAPDLLAGDDRRDLRVFLSNTDGTLTRKPKKLARNGEEVVFLSDAALICNRSDGDWRVEVLEAK